MLACASIGCQNAARYGLLFWVPVHYLGEGWKTGPQAWILLALPLGMALGAVCAGELSDRLFRSNRSRPAALFLGVAAIMAFLLTQIPSDNALLGIPLLALAGFFIYGPQACYWSLCPDLLGTSRTGTGVGVMNAFAYGTAAVGEILIGGIVNVGSTSDAFGVAAGFAAIGALLILMVRR
jgi:OPA family glycerol-3-phosphate transporter-like MFS transporter